MGVNASSIPASCDRGAAASGQQTKKMAVEGKLRADFGSYAFQQALGKTNSAKGAHLPIFHNA